MNKDNEKYNIVRKCIISFICCLCLSFVGCTDDLEEEDHTEESQIEVREIVEEEPVEVAPRYYETNTELNIRTGAGTEFDVLYTTQSGERLELTGNEQQVDDSLWYEVILSDGVIGWCSGNYGAVLDDEESLNSAMNEAGEEDAVISLDSLTFDQNSNYSLLQNYFLYVIQSVKDGRGINNIEKDAYACGFKTAREYSKSEESSNYDGSSCSLIISDPSEGKIKCNFYMSRLDRLQYIPDKGHGYIVEYYPNNEGTQMMPYMVKDDSAPLAANRSTGSKTAEGAIDIMNAQILNQ